MADIYKSQMTLRNTVLTTGIDTYKDTRHTHTHTQILYILYEHIYIIFIHIYDNMKSAKFFLFSFVLPNDIKNVYKKKNFIQIKVIKMNAWSG